MAMFGMKLPREHKQRLIEEVQHYFAVNHEEIGSIAAEAMLDFMIGKLGPHLYNHALGDARKAITERLAALEDELYALEKSV